MLIFLTALALLQEADRPWTDLAAEDSGRAYEAIWELAQGGDKSLDLLRERLIPRPPGPDVIRRLIEQLDSLELAAREVAARSLSGYGLAIEEPLRAAIKSATSAELRGRLETLLKAIDEGDGETPDLLRRLRALRVLERVASPAARDLLTTLEKGGATRTERRQAAAILAGRLRPAADGPQGLRAYEDLEALYRRKRPVPYILSLERLARPETARREGDYLAALFKQSLADETNGRTPWTSEPTWGGESNSAARDFRDALSTAFGDQAKGEAALSSIIWIVDHEVIAANQAAGFRALNRLDSPDIPALLKRLVSPAHPNNAIVKEALRQIGLRELRELAPEVAKLGAHHRGDVRFVAGQAAKDLGIEKLAEFVPETAFTPALEEGLSRIARMVRTPIPKDATWKRFTVTHPPWQEGTEPFVESFSAWLLDDKAGYRVLDAFGRERRLDRERTKISERTLAEEAASILVLKETPEGREALSMEGGLTAQFEASFATAPEVLVGIWCHARGDRKNSSALLLPCFEAAEDDRWVSMVIRDLLGRVYHQEMLEAFSHHRNYVETRVIAEHLMKPEFDGYEYQPRASELATQLARRGDDFKGFRLPTPEEWKAKSAELDRSGRIRYLAERLRLINSFQSGQPGGVSYDDKQYAESPWLTKRGDRREVINPFGELAALKLEIADLVTLVPFLADDNFMPTYSYWRDFHPGRTLHRAGWAVAELINEPAMHDLADLDGFTEADAEGKKRHLERTIQWCRDHAAMSRADLANEILRTSRYWHEVESAFGEGLRLKDARALPALLTRREEFPKRREEIAKICHDVAPAESVARAREWIADPEEGVRFWSGLILLRHGDRERKEGMETIRAILADGDGTLWHPRAVETLLAYGTPEARELACEIVGKKNFHQSDNWSPVVERLIRTGDRRVLDYALSSLASEEGWMTTSGEWEGQGVSRHLSHGDRAAMAIASWRLDDFKYGDLAPDEARKAQRAQLGTWLKAQFDKITAGGKPELRDPAPLQYPKWEIDAP